MAVAAQRASYPVTIDIARLMNIDTVASLFESSPIMAWSAALFAFNLALTALEACFDLASGKRRRWRDSGSNVLIFVAGTVLERAALGTFAFVCLLPFYLWLSPWEIPMSAWSWCAALLAADLTYYWMHRTEHERRALWALHVVHHLSRDYDLTVALRLSVFEGAVEWVFLVPMIVIGFNPFQAVIALIFVAQYQGWIHTEHVGRLGWFDTVFNTPSTHRVHHGSNPRYLNRNYGGVLKLWDHLFGTFQREDEPVRYGLTRDIGTFDPVRINTHELVRLWTDLRRCTTVRARLRLLLGPLGDSTVRPASTASIDPPGRDTSNDSGGRARVGG